MSFSLDKSRRIRRSSDYKRVYDEGARVSGKYLIAVIRSSEGPLRVGVTVSRKVGNACVRNLVKRRIREAVRQELAPALSGWDVVLIAKGQAGQKGRREQPRLNMTNRAGSVKRKPGGAKETLPAYPSFSGIVEDIRRITGRLSGV